MGATWQCEVKSARLCEAEKPCYEDESGKPFVFRLVDEKAFQEFGAGEIRSSPLRKVGTTWRNRVRVTRFDHTIRNAAPELREVSQVELTETSNGESTFVSKTSWEEIPSPSSEPDGLAPLSATSIESRGICKKVKRDQPWPE